MRRLIIHRITVGAHRSCALTSVCGRAAAQAPPQPAPPAAPPDFSKVEIKTTKLGANFYALEGQGGAIGVLAGPDGVLMVDAQFAPLTEKIVAAIKQISDRPIRFLVNTHVHGDHTGGNENLGKMGVTILARDRAARPARGRPATAAEEPRRRRSRSSPTRRRSPST